MSDTPQSSTDSLVASVSGDITRTIGELIHRLGEAHARERDEAVALVRQDAEEALRLVREESEAARLRSVEEAVAAARLEFEERQRSLIDETSARARADVEALRAELEGAARERVREAEDAAASRESGLRAQVAAAQRLAEDGATAGVLATHVGEREQRLAAMERLLRGIARLDDARSLRGALDALAEAVAEEAPRSAVFVVRGDEVRSWRASGLGDVDDEPAPACALAAAGPLQEATVSCQPVVVEAGALPYGPGHPLARLALAGHQAGLVAPVVVDGRTVALVYADDGETSDREVPAPWPEAVQILARHTARCLESITARRAIVARPVTEELAHGQAAAEALPMAADAESARRFARLLVSELKLYNEAAVDAGRQARDLRQRLAGPIRRARSQYDARVPASLPGRDDYFEQELVRTLGEGDPEVLGSRGLASA